MDYNKLSNRQYVIQITYRTTYIEKQKYIIYEIHKHTRSFDVYYNLFVGSRSNDRNSAAVGVHSERFFVRNMSNFYGRQRSNRNFVYSSDNVGELPERQSESSTAENALDRLKSLARLRMADTKIPSAADTVSREELEALRDLLDRNLRKYQNYDAHSSSGRKRPANDPYIGQIIDNLQNAAHQSVSGNRLDGHDHNNNNNNNNDDLL